MSTTLDQLYAAFRASAGVQTDTRKLQPGELFWALRGERFDGNRFAQQALQAGAQAAVVDHDADYPKGDNRYLPVTHTLRALQELARHHRQQWQGPLLGLTGSNGKTTTKGLLAAALQTWRPGLATPGNWNNHIGLPLTLLRLQPEHQWAVLELGDNRPGEIAELCRIADPTHGLITNIGQDHLEGYGSLAANARTKLELFDYMAQRPAGAGRCYVNVADPWLAPAAGQYANTLAYATSPNLQAEACFRAEARYLPGGRLGALLQPPQGAPLPVETQLTGGYNLENLLAAATAALDWGVPAQALQQGFAAYQPDSLRSQALQQAGRLLLLDAYNANPTSMRLAVQSLFERYRRVSDLGLTANPPTGGAAPPRVGLVLGDMLEMGVHTVAVHRRLGEFLKAFPYYWLLGVGPAMRHTVAAAGSTRASHAPTVAAVTEIQLSRLRACNLLLFKGSRGIAVERLLERL